MIYRIAIIGAGRIGSRHLQALGLIDRDIEVLVIDSSDSSLELAKKRFEEMPPNKFIRSVSYSNTLDSLKRDIDVAIVATNADIRRSIVEQILQRAQIRFFILEKVAFQSVADFQDIMGLLKEKKSKAWVNCSYRRMYPFYQEMKKSFPAGEKVFLNLLGGGWGLACSCIHLLDLFSYITGQPDVKLDGSGFDKVIHQSRREGFIELTGILRGAAKDGSEITLMDYHGMDAPYSYVVDILSRDAHYVIFESQGKAAYSLKADDWQWKETQFPFLGQSRLTHLIVQQILDTGDCPLASMEESFSFHKAMLEVFLSHLETVTGKKYNKCPIT